MNKKTVRDIELDNKTVLIRCDFNVPLDSNGNITDDSRIIKSLDTIKYVLSKNTKVILCSHLGRPKEGYDLKYSLKPVAQLLQKVLNRKVVLSNDVYGEDTKRKLSELKFGQILLLENVRFEKGETKNDEGMAKELASLADVFVNDAFGSAHRAHASTEGVAKYLPAVSGFLIEKEIEFLSNAIDDPKRPFVAILGGAKVSDKISVIRNLIKKVDKILIGGAMAYTFLKYLGKEVGTSLCENDMLDEVEKILEFARRSNVDIVLPVDNIIGNSLEDNNVETLDIDNNPKDKMGADIGPKTIENFKKIILEAKTIFWNGPLGAFEYAGFENGTKEIAKALSESKAITIIGGGDSAAAIKKYGLEDKITHISTGGGASMEFIEGKELPGITALNNKDV